MIPWAVGHELRATLLDYLRSTWSIADRKVENALFTFLSGNNGMFQGPYLRIGLPFAGASPDAAIPLDVAPPYPPHIHQLEAWERLSSRGRIPQATLITTGTGSGKTECFLYPILDHVLRESVRGAGGIKAIVLYPMNALASDQASRFASTIWNDERLRGRVRVGLFVGGTGTHSEMGRDHVVDQNDRLRTNPPDILLTNYRMLDLLLQRPKDARLWSQNQADTLRYLVLDELHTYDGAQGTDVACLIRRLAQRLGGLEGICPVGTSATIGVGDDTRSSLLNFAEQLFDQRFPEDAFIGETRIQPSDLAAEPASEERTPEEAGPWPQPGEDAVMHVAACARAWLSERQCSSIVPEHGALDRVALGDAVVRMPIVRALLLAAHARPRSGPELEAILAAQLPRFAAGSADERRSWIVSVLSMLSYSQRSVAGTILPLVSVQTTLWVREVRRLLSRVGEEPAFRFYDDAPPPESEAWFPRYTCQECGHGGWLVTESGPGNTLGMQYREIAHAFQEGSEDLRLLYEENAVEEHSADAGLDEIRRAYLDSKGKRLLDQAPDGAVFPAVCVATMEHRTCPACGSRDAIRMLAARNTTLSSVAVGHLFTTPLNTDRKLLTFSDSVQDAAHRAGFFGARTYRFALRTAMLAAVPRDAEIRLSELGDAVWRHWLPRLGNKAKGTSATSHLVATLLPVDLHWLESVVEWHTRLDEFVKNRQQANVAGEAVPSDVPEPSAGLIRDLQKRTAWECTRELGVAARIGRTLEQSGCLSVTVDRERFDEAVAETALLLKEKLGQTFANTHAIGHAIAGLITRLRLRGGIYDALLRGYIENGGEGVFLSKRMSPLLSPFTRESSRPRFLTDAPKAKRFDSVASTRGRTWTTDWLARSLGVADADLAARTYEVLLSCMSKAGILTSHVTDERGVGQRAKACAWALAPDALVVSRAHAFRHCDVCSYQLAGVRDSATDPLGHPCLVFRCPGSFVHGVELADGDTSNIPVATYYKRFYERGQLGRLWSREHTGLIPRAPREELELEFKQRPRPDSPNLLSCTPTLEMGIDIGDLSATLLCSVPPKSSNYVQRVGRAGRKTGNALVLAFASTAPHDLYFFQQPLEAMIGAIHPPGCYLSAPEVLKRQALAFAFDGYARSGGVLPGRVDALWGVAEKKRFPQPILDFIARNRGRLHATFIEMFRGKLTESAKAEVQKHFAVLPDGLSPLEHTLDAAAKDARGRRDDLRRLAQKLDEMLKQLNSDVAVANKVSDIEDERRRINDELRFVWHQLRALGEKDLFGWLTEDGCLPNYAFPERGVRLDAYVRRAGSGNAPEHYEWIRAPGTAITELAPFNTFYASSRRVKIDGVELRREAKPIEWRFCRSCHHASQVSAQDAEQAECPSCGDQGYEDVGLRRSLLPLAQVFAVADHRDAVLGDDGDDRERSFYESATLFEGKAKARDAWSNDEVGFGFEVQDELVMRQLNLGPSPKKGSPGRFALAGREHADVRFTVCTVCGQAHVPDEREAQKQPRQKHRSWCAERKKPDDKQSFRQIHLLRELRSEALRLVLPIAAREDTGGDVANFRAALRVGLRRFYGGEPDFLEVTTYDEPLIGNEGRRRYLVVMDRIPGGTGLLTELALNKGASLEHALKLAHDTLRDCLCRTRTPAVPACYQCLYAYREQADFASLNRERALALVETALAAFKQLKKVDSVGTMTQSDVLESELEHRFVAALQARVRDAKGVFEEIEDGHWRITVGGRTWMMRAQVELGSDRVAVPCRADFVLYPDLSEQHVRPIAIFTDGLAYHVTPTRDVGRLGDDARKRFGISSGGEMMTWSLTWKDVVCPDSPAIPRWVGDGTAFQKLQALLFKLDEQSDKQEKLGALLSVLDADPVRGLVALLGAPTRLDEFARVVAFMKLQPVRRSGADECAERHAEWLEAPRVPEPAPQSSAEGSHAFCEFDLGSHTRVRADLPHANLGALLTDSRALRVVVRLEDEKAARNSSTFELSWRLWLRAWNLLQTLDGAVLTTSENIASNGDERRPSDLKTEERAGVEVAEDSRLVTVREVTDSGAVDVLTRLLSKHPTLPAPRVPFEARALEFVQEGDLEFGWPEQRVAGYFDGQRATAEALKALGWNVFPIERGLHIEELESALGLVKR